MPMNLFISSGGRIMTQYRFECYIGALNLSAYVSALDWDILSFCLYLSLTENHQTLTALLSDMNSRNSLGVSHKYQMYISIPWGFGPPLRILREIQFFWLEEDLIKLAVWGDFRSADSLSMMIKSDYFPIGVQAPPWGTL
jgi:hypothetical protein